jgi:hypothetical protein
VQGWLLRLSGEILEREQLARLAAVCGTLLHTSPVLPGVVTCDTINVETPAMLQILKNTRKQRGETTRDWLWQKLPQAWQSPVSLNEQGTAIL